MAKSKPANSKVFSCPQCPMCNFMSLVAVREHFVEEDHRIHCSGCNRVFKDALSLIQHYQKHARPINTEQKAAAQAAPKASVKQAPSSNRASKKLHKDNKRQTSTQDSGAAHAESLRNLPIPASSTGSVRVKPPKLDPQATQVANPPIILDPMEQDLILRYLQARAHSLTRLRTQGYALTIATDPTPRLSKGSVPIHEFELAPPRSTKNTQRTRRAIVIDCEMVEVANGCSELAFLSAIDFLTGEVLINNYVHPTSKVVFWRSKYSGITPALMASAVAAGQALNGWPEARKRLWEFATRDTVLIGHSLNHDLDVLGILHSKVVDSSILTGEAVFPALLPTQRLTRTWGLKKLAQELLAHKIQTGKAGHDALEDAYATRNVVIWCIRNPELLKEWAEQARHQEAQHKAEKSQRKHRKARSKGKTPASKPVGSPRGLDSNSSSDPFDVAEYLVECGWPHPDTGYEPWSD